MVRTEDGILFTWTELRTVYGAINICHSLINSTRAREFTKLWRELFDELSKGIDFFGDGG